MEWLLFRVHNTSAAHILQRKNPHFYHNKALVGPLGRDKPMRLKILRKIRNKSHLPFSTPKLISA